MKVLAVSGRHSGSVAALERDAVIVTGLCRTGIDVVWIVPEVLGSSPVAALVAAATESGARVSIARSEVPPFALVTGRITDPSTELLVAARIRAEFPDVVHVLDFCGTSSVNLPWIATSLGAPSVVNLEVARTLCHRGTLVHASGEACGTWDDPERCARCCRPLHGPSPRHFRNRVEMMLAGLQPARRVILASAAERELLETVGGPRVRMRPGGIIVLEDPAPEALLAVYAEVCAPVSVPSPAAGRVPGELDR